MGGGARLDRLGRSPRKAPTGRPGRYPIDGCPPATTDNADGTTTVMEAMRILQAIGARGATAPGVGSIVALTYAAAIDDPSRFKSSKSVGPLFGLTPRRYQSGETDVTGRISKAGDATVRTALYEAANAILERSAGNSPLRRWGLAVARRAGMRKAKVALARKLAVILHRMLVDGTPFDAAKAAAAA